MEHPVPDFHAEVMPQRKKPGLGKAGLSDLYDLRRKDISRGCASGS